MGSVVVMAVTHHYYAHLDCTYNSWTLLSCSWEADSNFTSSPCYISTNVKNRDIKGSCDLTPNSNPRNCTIKLKNDLKPVKEILTVDHKLNMSVICSDTLKRNASVTFLYEFSAYHNLLLDPPSSTEIKMISDDVWNLTWRISQRSKIKNIETEVQYKRVNSLWQDARNIRVKNANFVALHNLHPKTQYEAKVRVNQTDFAGGRWSDWGRPVQWTTLEVALDCTHNSFDTVTCSWRTARNLTSTPCYLLAYVNNNNENRRIKGMCYLSPSGDYRSCVMNLTTNGIHILSAMTFSHHMNVSVMCSIGNFNRTVTSLSAFFPFYNLRLDPPIILDIKMLEDGVWNLTWVNKHRNYIDNVETEVHFKPVKWSWKDAKRFTLSQYDLSAFLRDLHPDTLYEARVRVNQTDIQGGRWSEWSKPVQWATPPKGSAFPIPGAVAISVVLLILAVALCSSKRVKKTMWISVPDPSPFFHPLIDTHKGNFKKWLATPYVFSSTFVDPSPLDISSLNINGKIEDQQMKCTAPASRESDKNKIGHSGSSFNNKEYFSSVYFGYDHFPSVVVNGSLHSPTEEDMPLFKADYLCAPQSIARFAFHNGSYEQEALPQTMPMPIFVEETITEVECEDGHSDISTQETENVREGKANSEDQEETKDTIPETPLVQQHENKPSKEADLSDYLSLKDLNQKHCQWV
ncbi:interleukin-2 receptor subunit beta isoform X2 [Engystomops pustulosus]|uniref:interleukin-2 receptor subunit beta isoform X2 n=1 Tax=Engystomops pustulosus TaxID=76066 RepID=UPI003AFA0AE7